MKIATYVLSLILSAFMYLLFASYMTVSAGLISITPLVSLYCSLIIFGFLSWFHFFNPKIGGILLIICIVAMVLSWLWPINLMIEIDRLQNTSTQIEVGVPLILSLLTILFAWKSKNQLDVAKETKIVLAIPVFLLASYSGVHFTITYFGLFR